MNCNHAVCAEAGIPKRIVPHQLRHYAASRTMPRVGMRATTPIGQSMVSSRCKDTQARIVAEFRRYLLLERGLSPLTLLNYVPIVEQFWPSDFTTGLRTSRCCAHSTSPDSLCATRADSSMSLFRQVDLVRANLFRAQPLW